MSKEEKKRFISGKVFSDKLAVLFKMMKSIQLKSRV
jgi:hypothetical protein